ncbi:MAG: site-specific DNA-methyltransferase [Deltaproteobacteria bacterium]|nr:site-specific DNA-methyltransferase [Deltaproteobacteria bacterium]
MPTLQFKGKNIIWNHHLSIPYHTLDEVGKQHFQPEKANGNLIIEGDNLLALKALLPQYAGKVKCIYIDPPYNTGNEGWVYNDNANSPMLKEWLGKEVGKDDLTRHDKWLCMMVPRLKLLRELLKEDGVIFVSIDDNEVHHLRMLMDEVFGEENIIAELVWNLGTGTEAGHFTRSHEYILSYAKYRSKVPYFATLDDTPITHGALKKISRANPASDIIFPSGIEFEGTNAIFEGELGNSEKQIIVNGKMIFEDGKLKKPVTLRAGWAMRNQIISWIEGKETFDSKGQKVKRFFFNRQGILWYEKERETTHPKTVLIDIAKTKDGTTEIEMLFGEKVMDFPKSSLLIKFLVSLTTNNNDIILDSFAGSGTTMHAVMDLNKEDGGNRKCILVQMTEATKTEPKKNICKDITRERVMRTIDKYDYDSGFQYFKVGIPVDAETLLSGQLPTFKQFADYVYYLCTGESLKNKSAVNEKSFFIGEHGNSVIYLVYRQDFDELTRLALNLSLAEKLTAEHPKKKIIVYAPACFLEEDYMKEKNIVYVGIPYNLFQRSGA